MRDVVLADGDLHDPAGVARADEGDAAVVAPVRHPVGEDDDLLGVLNVERPGL